ncbi:MAG: aminotransferase class I/II-fold pyridoxal phosphate-dependent enzyme, partial [Caldisericia bacterium]|nr:aminotransferase class I/II-fold pyridoxal phosphate-dependent enzyme [Caldisericia bacterium]
MSKDYLSERTKGIFPSKIREVMDKAKELKDTGINIIDFSIGRPDFDTPGHIKEAAKKALDKGMVHYTASAGTVSLRESICLRMKQDFNLETHPAEIIVTLGATEANYIATQTLLNHGDEVLIPEPMYVYYTGWSFLGGAKAISFPLEILIHNPLSLEKYITKKTKLLILTSPHNPTGQVIGKEALKVVADLAKKNNFFIISDDIYNKILYDSIEYCSIALFEKMKERTLIIGSLSKTYAMDGWRVGYLIGPEEIIPEALKMHQHVLSCPNTFVQEAAKIALTESQDCVE